MGDEKLISLIKRHEVIYNKRCSEYRDISLRNVAWEQIAREYGKNIDTCKEEWNKLRNCYNNAVKRRQKKNEEDKKKMAPWRFEEQMSFLRPHLEGRYNTDSLNFEYCSESVPSPETGHSFEEEEEDISDIHQEISVQNLTPTPSYKRKASPDRDNAGYLVEILKMMKGSQDRSPYREELDDIDHFFLSMGKTLKRLPKVDQIRIKLDLHKAITDAELKQIGVNEFVHEIEVKEEPVD